MKHSILIIGTVVLSVLNINATTLNPSLNENTTTTISIGKNKIIEVFVWSVKTKSGKFSGTSKSLAHAERMMQLSAVGDIVLEQKIVKHFVFKNDLNYKQYYWEVESTRATAKGFSSSEEKARAIIALVAKGDIITYKIIVIIINKN